MTATSARLARVVWFVVAVAVCLVSESSAFAVRPEANPSLAQTTGLPPNLKLKGFPIAAYTPETSLTFAGFGLVLAPPTVGGPNAHTSTLLAAGAYTLNGQWMLNLSPNLYLDGGKYNVKSSLSLLHWPTDFFGLGSNTDEANKEKFNATAIVFDTVAKRRLWDPHLYLGVEYEFSSRNIDALQDGPIMAHQVVGSEGGNISGVGLNLTWDTRDNCFAATQGSLLQGSVMTYTPLLGSDFQYTRLKLDARHYFDLGHDQVFAMQGLWESHIGEVPFYKLAKLGGQKRLRGIYKGRFRDKNMLLLQGEYRTPPLWRLRLAGFGGLGEVWGDNGAFGLGALKWSAGVGLRLAVDKKQGVNVRADYGWSPDGNGFYLSIGEAF